MELFINDTPVGISPEKNDTVDILLRTVERQLESDLIIASVVIDGKYVAHDDPKVLNLPVSDINKIELTVATRIEIGVALLDDAKNFITISFQELKNGSFSKKNEIMQSFAWIIESLDALRSALAFPPADLTILRAAVADALRFLDREISLDEALTLAEILEKMPEHFTLLQKKLLNQEEFVRENVIMQLQSTKNILPDLATYFQTGKDLQALAELGTVIDTLEMFARYSASQPADLQAETFAVALKDLSSQLLEAFENKDYILIADLLEYELAEQIDAILEAHQ